MFGTGAERVYGTQVEVDVYGHNSAAREYEY